MAMEENEDLPYGLILKLPHRRPEVIVQGLLWHVRWVVRTIVDGDTGPEDRLPLGEGTAFRAWASAMEKRLIGAHWGTTEYEVIRGVSFYTSESF